MCGGLVQPEDCLSCLVADLLLFLAGPVEVAFPDDSHHLFEDLILCDQAVACADRSVAQQVRARASPKYAGHEERHTLNDVHELSCAELSDGVLFDSHVFEDHLHCCFVAALQRSLELKKVFLLGVRDFVEMPWQIWHGSSLELHFIPIISVLESQFLCYTISNVNGGMDITLFHEVGLVLVSAGFLSLIAYVLRQPLIVGYIFTGLLVGPSVFGITQSPEVFEVLSQIGVAFLLFLVGLNLNWRTIKDVGGVSLFAGLGQVVFTSLIGYGIARVLGFEVVESWFLSVGFAFSSTIVIVKLLSDKQDMDRFYGRISVGTLIVQDLIALVVLIVISALRTGGESLGDVLLFSFGKGILLIAGLLFVSQFVLVPLFSTAARQQELLFILAISWCFVVATITLWLGFGIEIGALLAGMSLSGTRYHTEVEHKIRPLRDFFLIIFFIVLGTHLSPDIGWETLVPAFIFSAFILIGNPLILLAILRLFGYHPRTGFLVGVTMAQISEFSFIVLTAGIGIGLIDVTLLPLATIVGMVTMVLSTYLINFNEEIYPYIEWMFRWISPNQHDPDTVTLKTHEVVMIGHEELGQAVLPAVQKMTDDYIVVDFDPGVVQRLSSEEIPVVYGDAANEDFLAEHQVHRSKMVICTVADKTVNRDLLAYLKKKKSRATIVLTARTSQLTEEFYAHGASFVINPAQLGGHSFAGLLKSNKTSKVSWKSTFKKFQTN